MNERIKVSKNARDIFYYQPFHWIILGNGMDWGNPCRLQGGFGYGLPYLVPVTHMLPVTQINMIRLLSHHIITFRQHTKTLDTTAIKKTGG